MTTTEAPSGVTDETGALLAALGVSRDLIAGGALEVRSPITGEVIARVKEADAAGAEAAIAASNEAFRAWRKLPAPRRGELVRLLGEELRSAKTALGRLVTIETGKIVSEGLVTLIRARSEAEAARRSRPPNPTALESSRPKSLNLFL